MDIEGKVSREGENTNQSIIHENVSLGVEYILEPGTGDFPMDAWILVGTRKKGMGTPFGCANATL